MVEGRDITTVVAPDADVRILLTASEEVRMARRDAELGEGTVSTATCVTRCAPRSGRLHRCRVHDAADGVVTSTPPV